MFSDGASRSHTARSSCRRRGHRSSLRRAYPASASFVIAARRTTPSHARTPSAVTGGRLGEPAPVALASPTPWRRRWSEREPLSHAVRRVPTSLRARAMRSVHAVADAVLLARRAATRARADARCDDDCGRRNAVGRRDARTRSRSRRPHRESTSRSRSTSRVVLAGPRPPLRATRRRPGPSEIRRGAAARDTSRHVDRRSVHVEGSAALAELIALTMHDSVVIDREAERRHLSRSSMPRRRTSAAAPRGTGSTRWRRRRPTGENDCVPTSEAGRRRRAC